MKIKLDLSILAIVIFMIILSLAYGGMYLFEPTPLEYKNIPFSVEPRVVAIGETFYFNVSMCGPENKEHTMVYRSWFYHINTGEELHLVKGSTTSPKGCTVFENIPKLVPLDLPPGEYLFHYEVEVESEYTARVFNYRIKTERFTITK